VPVKLSNLALDFREDENSVKEILVRRFSLSDNEISSFRVVRKSLDARKKSSVRYVWTVEFSVTDEAAFFGRFGGDPDIRQVMKKETPEFPHIGCDKRIVIAGMGPAGLFAAVRLSEYGLAATIAERGKPVEERLRDVQAFWSRGELDSESNVQFGEGGAGTFSDGKLTTRVRDENLQYVLEKFVRFGAPPEILYLGKPHIGTDRLRHVVREIRKHLETSGFEILFRHKLTDLAHSGGRLVSIVLNDRQELHCDHLVLAPGHSARDTYEMLLRRRVAMENKPFAVGLRVEHPQELINRIQYGTPGHPRLPAADYALAYNNPRTKRSVYSFCMCPGGVVVAGSSEQGAVVTNGMSNYLRNAPFANSALVVPVGEHDFPGPGPLAGVEFQRHWERRAFLAGGGDYHAPAQNLMSFLGRGRTGHAVSSYRPGVREADLNETLPEYVTETIREGISYFDRKMRGFITADATLTGVETRTSAPVRIVRGDDMQSVNLKGLYPVGEGAGYAGGIVSAALDGIRAADMIARLIIESGRSKF
jgi:uncharacterized FAD-dependent dehydrogenase